MRRIESDSFNKRVAERISEPHNRLGEINFENVNVVEEKFQGIGTGTGTIDIKFSDKATIDGVEMAKVNGTMRYLEGSKTATLDIFKLVPLLDNGLASGSETTYIGKFAVPPQYDGRNSFVEVTYGGMKEDALTTEDFENVAPEFKDDFVLNWMSSDNSVTVRKSTFKTENYIKVKSKLDEDSITSWETENDDTFCLYVRIYLWRYI